MKILHILELLFSNSSTASIFLQPIDTKTSKQNTILLMSPFCYKQLIQPLQCSFFLQLIFVQEIKDRLAWEEKREGGAGLGLWGGRGRKEKETRGLGWEGRKEKETRGSG
jgi:hypothetical protein